MENIIYLLDAWLYILCAVLCLFAQSCLTLCDPMDYSPSGSSVHGDSIDKNTGVGCHTLFQEIVPTQGLNPGLLHCRWILYCLSHQRSPGILEWVAYPFSIGSSHPRNQTGISCIAGGFFTSWAAREALYMPTIKQMVSIHSHWELFPEEKFLNY